MVFNNRFNNKDKDPLVEAAKAAMELGQKRREAIAAVNEEFGVFNRNAVVRENLAAYDARIEQVFNGMKSGNLTEELSPKQKKMASLAGNPKKIDAADLSALRKGAKIDEKKGCMYEGKPNDGNLANNYPPYDKVTRGDVIAGRLGKDQMGGKKKVDEKKMYEGSPMDSDVVGGGAVTKDSKPVVSQTAPKADTSGPSAADKAGLAAKIGAMKEAKLDELKAPTGKTAMAAYRRAERSDDEVGDWTRSNRIYKSMKKRYPGKSARNQKDTGKAEMDDYSPKDLGYGRTTKKSGKLTKSTEKETKSVIKSRLGKHTKPKHLPEETIEEAVSRKHFQQVADLIKSHDSQEKRNELASHHASIFSKQNPRFDHGRFHKAAGSTAHEEPKKMEEAAYSAKAARAGKDIGKPGKMFSKIAKKAGKRYGSEERGKKVAGAILAKIRAKHMKEENLEEISAFGSAFKAARQAGKSTFSMGGKSFTTAMKGASSTPTPPSRPAGLGADKPVGDPGYKSGQTVSLKPIADTGSAQAAEPPKAAPSAPAAQPKGWSPPAEIATREKQASTAAAGAPTPPSRPADLGGSTPAPAKPMQNPDQNITKLKESVQVGDNKYRIF